MRAVIAVSVTALLGCTLQSCQKSEKADALIGVAQAGQSAAPSPSEPALRLKSQARAYAERLSQGHCGTPERMEFDKALLVVEGNLPVLRNNENAPTPGNAAIAGQAEEVVAETRLDVADAARTGGCPEIANAHYKAVVRAFRGPAFARYWQRAELGLSAMQL